MTPEQVLQAIPQQAPFRFLDEILELDNTHIVGRYTFKPDEFFYRGHFPGDPVTPGVILTEAMTQTSVVELGLYVCAHTMPGDELQPEARRVGKQGVSRGRSRGCVDN